MKLHTSQVLSAPRPVLPAHIAFSTAYVVVRGDGKVKVFDTLYGGEYQVWDTLANKQGANMFTADTILIPLDLLTATRLGLVSVEDLELPEGAKALLNIIK